MQTSMTTTVTGNDGSGGDDKEQQQPQEQEQEQTYVASYPMIGGSRETTSSSASLLRKRTNTIIKSSSRSTSSSLIGRRGTSNKSSTSNSFTRSIHSTGGLTPCQKMYIDSKIMNRSILILRFAILADAINMTILQPNYPFMVTPNAYPDSFPSTEPFDYSSAVTFLMMMAKLGAAVASLGIGSLSDKIGRKPCIVFCLGASCVGSIIKYFCRINYWAFCAACLLNGMVSATMPVATAYIGDVVTSREQAQKQMTIIFGLFLLGMGGGGIVATVMTSTGLFTPLFVGAAINLVATVVTLRYLIEPNKSLASKSKEEATTKVGNKKKDDTDEDENTNQYNDDDDNDNNHHVQNSDIENSNSEVVASEHKKYNSVDKEEAKGSNANAGGGLQQPPLKLDYRVYAIIVVGTLADTIGSSGMFYLNYTVLAYEKYIQTGIVSDVAYKWTNIVIYFAIIPGIIIAPIFFRKIGIALSSVLANFFTGLMTCVILYLIILPPAEAYMYWITMLVIFVGYPFTVISQVSVTPMVQVVAPPDKRGFCQGFASSINQIGGPIATYLLGLLIQETSDVLGVWVTIIVSFIAAIINLPLIKVKGMGPIPTKTSDDGAPKDDDITVFEDEDPELIKHIMEGKWVPIEDLVRINKKRRLAGHSYLVVPYGSYQADKDRLSTIRKQARSDVQAQCIATELFFADFNNSTEDVKVGMCEGYNRSALEIPQDVIKKQSEEFGKWITDYLSSNGYHFHVGSQLYKAMIMQAFPKINDGESKLTVENCEKRILSFMRVLDSLSKEVSSEYEEEEIYDYGNLLAARTGYTEDLLTMKKEN